MNFPLAAVAAGLEVDLSVAGLEVDLSAALAVVAAVVPEVDLFVAAVVESGAYLSAVVVEAPPIFPMASTRFHADYSVEFSCH